MGSPTEDHLLLSFSLLLWPSAVGVEKFPWLVGWSFCSSSRLNTVKPERNPATDTIILEVNPSQDGRAPSLSIGETQKPSLQSSSFISLWLRVANLERFHCDANHFRLSLCTKFLHEVTRDAMIVIENNCSDTQQPSRGTLYQADILIREKNGSEGSPQIEYHLNGHWLRH